ncbi:MAG: DUF480 domain-containing protein [Planctomycetaceae bacterium]|nr:DUF480 domain-containing protein [Planctomycetaceae bacterium]
MDSYSTDPGVELPQVRELGRRLRRVLGVLIEKGLTTPDQYPLTLKAATAGCNQKSNRDPVTNYSEDDVLRAMDELRELGLVAVVLPSTGRTERFRHYVRKRFPFSEAQIALLAELWLRGRQQLGELRARASRMVPIESLDALRVELQGLLEQGYVQASGSLERRGVEVDHGFYLAAEGQQLAPMAAGEDEDDSVAGSASSRAETRASTPVVSPAVGAAAVVTASPAVELTHELQELRQQHVALVDEVADLRDQLSELQASVSDLKRDLGV